VISAEQAGIGVDLAPQVNKFSIDTRPDGSVAQFYSDLTLKDFDGKELQRKTISVNDPFRYGGVTMYQTDWSLAAVTVRLVEQPASDSSSSSAAQTGVLLQQLQDQAEQQQAAAAGEAAPAPSSSSNTRLPQRAFSLPFASLEGKPGVPKGSKLYATFLPLELPPEDGRPPRGISCELTVADHGPGRAYQTL
jgi:cytochrome c biogenesis protein